jgi:hypothetical protein
VALAGNPSSVGNEAGRPSVTAGTRIGLAGLRNDQNGMLVMVDIGALEPGNYLVGIDDAALIFPSGTARVEPADRPTRQAAPLPAQPAIRPTQPTGTNVPPAVQPAPPAAAPPPTLNQIGTLTVDNSGTGRMQQLVEGLQVRDVLGLALFIYQQPKADQPTLPANLDPTSDPGTPNPQAQNPTNSTKQAQNTAAPADQPQLPVAAGVIRLIADRRPIGTAQNGTREQSPPVPPTELPTAQREDETAPPR